MCPMHFVCAALHVMGLGCGFNIVFYDAIVSWPFAGRWATHMEKCRAAAQITSCSSREVARLSTVAQRVRPTQAA
eukprot:COSAG05_NODE_536_length_8861_cov_4.614700_4_plen_75_part_00